MYDTFFTHWATQPWLAPFVQNYLISTTFSQSLLYSVFLPLELSYYYYSEVPDMKEWYFKSLFSLILSAIDRIVYLPFFQEDLGHNLFRLQLGQRSA